MKIYWKPLGNTSDLLYQITSIKNILDKNNINEKIVYIGFDLILINPFIAYFLNNHDLFKLKIDIDFNNTLKQNTRYVINDDISIYDLNNLPLHYSIIYFKGLFNEYTRFINSEYLQLLCNDKLLDKLILVQYPNLSNSVVLNVSDNVTVRSIKNIYNKYFKGLDIITYNDDISFGKNYNYIYCKEDDLFKIYLIKNCPNVICSDDSLSMFGSIINNIENKKIIVPYDHNNKIIPYGIIKENIYDVTISIYTVCFRKQDINSFIDSISKFFTNYNKNLIIYYYGDELLKIDKISNSKYNYSSLKIIKTSKIWIDKYLYDLMNDTSDMVYFFDGNIKIKKFNDFNMFHNDLYIYLEQKNKPYLIDKDSLIYIENVSKLDSYDFCIYGGLRTIITKMIIYIFNLIEKDGFNGNILDYFDFYSLYIKENYTVQEIKDFFELY